jgi:two-component system response regulator YesN
LLIVDDEKIIRETIYSIIDWSSLNIAVAGVCKDGIEAFDAIVDEYPDIVLTDIKMPGLSGIELIQKVTDADLNVEFAILSGYGEFEFAQSAMRYGVKHYLLKPCNEKEIIQVIQDCVASCKKNIILRLDNIISELFDAQGKLNNNIWQKYYTLLSAQNDSTLIKNQLIKLLLTIDRLKNHNLPTESLSEYIMLINSCDDIPRLLHNFENMMSLLFSSEPQHRYKDCVERVIDYVNKHLSDSNLSLKWIAENYLYMNADYVSKQFVQQTGYKFSAWLTDIRIQEAQKLLQKSALASPSSVAEMVGFGNNPQYFSQIFKKNTGITPSAYMKQFN